MRCKQAFIILMVTGLLCVTQVAWAACLVTLTVAEKREDIVLGSGGDYPKTHSVILKPTAPIEPSETCGAYHVATEFH